MYDKFKNQILTNFLAFAGYPLIWYIIEAIYIINVEPLTVQGTKSLYGFGFVTSLFFCPYMVLTLILALLLFIVGFIYKKIRKLNNIQKNNNIFYNVFFNIGFSLYLFFCIYFILYISYCLITDILHIE